MSVLSDIRADIKATLTLPGVKVYDHIPGRVNVPAVLLSSGSPLLNEGDTYGTFTAHFKLTLAVSPGDNDRQTDALDDLVGAVIVALDGKYDVASVSTYYRLGVNNAEYLSADIDITDNITFRSE